MHAFIFRYIDLVCLDLASPCYLARQHWVFPGKNPTSSLERPLGRTRSVLLHIQAQGQASFCSPSVISTKKYCQVAGCCNGGFLHHFRVCFSVEGAFLLLRNQLGRFLSTFHILAAGQSGSHLLQHSPLQELCHFMQSCCSRVKTLVYELVSQGKGQTFSQKCRGRDPHPSFVLFSYISVMLQ